MHAATCNRRCKQATRHHVAASVHSPLTTGWDHELEGLVRIRSQAHIEVRCAGPDVPCRYVVGALRGEATMHGHVLL